MVTQDVDLELRQQLKEAGRQLSNPPVSDDELLHILEQTEKLLSLVDQSPNSKMQEALNAPMKALVDDSLLKHSNLDVKVSVAICICEITRITAPEAPYSDEEMKGVFHLIVSSFENLWDESSRSYSKRLSILDTVCKVRSSVIMLDLELDNLIVQMFEHFVKSVRDHHHDKGFPFMVNIMALVIAESEDISAAMLKPILASIRNNSEGVLPVARKLGEEVIKKSANKLRPYLKQALKVSNDSLDNYSQVLTSVCEGTTNVNEHNADSASMLQKADEIKLAPASDDPVQVMSNGKLGNGSEEGSDDKVSKKSEVIDHPDSNQTSSVVQKSAMAESKPEPTSNRKETKSAEPTDSSHGDAENRCGKSTVNLVSDRINIENEVADVPFQSASPLKEIEIVNARPLSGGKSIIIKKGIRSKKKSSAQIAAPSTDVLTKAPEGMSDAEMKSPKRARKKTPKADNNKLSAASGSDVGPQEKVPEGMSDLEMISPKRTRKKTLKAEDNKPSVTSGSDVEPSEKVPERMSDVEMISPKRVRKKTPKTEANKPSATSGSNVETKKISIKKVNAVDSESKLGKRSGKKVDAANAAATSGSDTELLKRSSKKVDTIDSGSKPDLVVTSGSDTELVKNSTKKVATADSGSKRGKSSGKKVGAKKSVAKKGKAYVKKTDGGESESKKSKQGDKKVDAGNSEVQPLKQSGMKKVGSDSEDKPLKQTGKKGDKSKVLTMPSEDIANHDEGTDSEDTPLKVSENVDGRSDSDDKPLKLSAKKGNKSSSSVVKSSSKKKGDRKLGRGKSIEEKMQPKTVSDDDGMDVPLMLALKTAAKGGGKLEETRASSSKRKRSVGKTEVAGTGKYDGSLIDQKVKVWWPEDKMYYEGVVASFDATQNKHKVLYLDGEEETLNLEDEIWEIIQEYSVQYEEKALEAEAQNTDDVPESPIKKKSKITSGRSAQRSGGPSMLSAASKSKSGGGNKGKGKGKVGNKPKAVINSNENEKSQEDEQKSAIVKMTSQEPHKIVYKSKGRRNKSKTGETKDAANESSEPKSTAEDLKELKDADAAKEPESVGENPKIGSKSRQKRKKT